MHGLYKMYETMTGSDWRTPLMINVTNHYVVGHMGKLYDNHQSLGRDSRKFHYRNKKVEQVWKLERIKK